MKIKTPFHRIRYRVLQKSWSYRSLAMAFKVWWEWDVLPWFKKIDYLWEFPERPFYRWERWTNKWVKENMWSYEITKIKK